MSVLTNLLEITIYSTIIVFAIILFKKIFAKRISATLQYAVWILLIIRLLLPVTFDSDVHLFTLPQAQYQQAEQTALKAGADTARQQNTYGTAAIQNYGQTQTNTQDSNQSPQQTRLDWVGIVIVIWLAGIGVFLIRWLVSYLIIRSEFKKNRLETPDWLAGLAEDCRRQLNIRRAVPVNVQQAVESPALTVQFAPTILIPASMADEAYFDDLRYSLMHELAHYKRRDYIICMFLTLLNAVYWFNPVIYFAFAQIRLDMETACDATVLKGLDAESQKEYA